MGSYLSRGGRVTDAIAVIYANRVLSIIGAKGTVTQCFVVPVERTMAELHFRSPANGKLMWQDAGQNPVQLAVGPQHEMDALCHRLARQLQSRLGSSRSLSTSALMTGLAGLVLGAAIATFTLFAAPVPSLPPLGLPPALNDIPGMPSLGQVPMPPQSMAAPSGQTAPCSASEGQCQFTGAPLSPGGLAAQNGLSVSGGRRPQSETGVPPEPVSAAGQTSKMGAGMGGLGAPAQSQGAAPSGGVTQGGTVSALRRGDASHPEHPVSLEPAESDHRSLPGDSVRPSQNQGPHSVTSPPLLRPKTSGPETQPKPVAANDIGPTQPPQDRLDAGQRDISMHKVTPSTASPSITASSTSTPATSTSPNVLRRTRGVQTDELEALRAINYDLKNGLAIEPELIKKLPDDIAAKVIMAIEARGLNPTAINDQEESLPRSVLAKSKASDPYGVPNIPDRMSWAAIGHPSIPLPGGGDIKNSSDMAFFGFAP